MTNITIQDFHHDIAAAEEASKSGPVLITDEGQTKHVLLDIGEFERMAAKSALLTSAGQLSAGSLWDLIQELPKLPEELVDYEFPKMDVDSQPHGSD